jgi:23S rRNA pseudouridine1911/1915/1917 synthase
MGPDEPLAILWDDPHLIAVVKPAGVLTQGFAGGEATLEDAVRVHLRADDPGSVYLGTVHRLDRPVSGVVVWARTPKAAHRLAEGFARREVTKEYWGMVEGDGPLGEVWDDWLGPVDTAGFARVADEGSPGARRAITRVRPLRGQTPEGTTLVELRPETGRTHQLRAQASARRRPIVGDRAYGSVRTFPAGIALHARSLGFIHPASRREMRLFAPLPGAWRKAGVVVPGAS